MIENKCKICCAKSLSLFAHTAKCRDCGVLLYYPYPQSDSDFISTGEEKDFSTNREWYSDSSFYNHSNFTNMVRFAMDENHKGRELDILDFGGGGGQFALVLKSHFLQSNVYITDIDDNALLDEWSDLNTQIPFRSFDKDTRKFDFIFLNDVFEHLSDPVSVLQQLKSKLKPEGKIFIDTPKQFWIYPLTRILSKSIYTKVLKGTVSTAHLQIWSKKAFDVVTSKSKLTMVKYVETSEYTMPPNFYMKNMGIENPLLKFAGFIFYKNAKIIAKNKIMCLLS